MAFLFPLHSLFAHYVHFRRAPPSMLGPTPFGSSSSVCLLACLPVWPEMSRGPNWRRGRAHALLNASSAIAMMSHSVAGVFARRPRGKSPSPRRKTDERTNERTNALLSRKVSGAKRSGEGYSQNENASPLPSTAGAIPSPTVWASAAGLLRSFKALLAL